MPQQPLTPSGVQQKLTELYALNDVQLQAESNALKDNFRQWTKDNFSLNAEQTVYLDNMDAEWIEPTSYTLSIAIRYRRAVTLTVTGSPGASKLVRSSDNMVFVQRATGVEVTGSAQIDIEYYV